jgi:hypothetical protein
MDTSPSRRTLLQSAAGLALVANRAPAAKSAQLPTVKLGKHEVTRLIIGSNTFNGYSYSLPSLDQHMREWSTPENVCKVLQQAEENGINTYQFSYHPRAMSDLKRHQAEGGKLQWILLGGGDMKDNLALIPDAAKLGPIGIVHHGGVTDQRFRDGQHAKVHEFLKRVRDTGVMVGLSSHRPQNVEYAEEHNWDIDFYMACFHQLSRPKAELKNMLGELPIGKTVFLEGDPARMCRVIQKTTKTCLAFKILGAGRSAESKEDLEKAFKFAFDNIKPYDAVIVGMYPRFKDEVRENAEVVRRVAGMPT